MLWRPTIFHICHIPLSWDFLDFCHHLGKIFAFINLSKWQILWDFSCRLSFHAPWFLTPLFRLIWFTWGLSTPRACGWTKMWKRHWWRIGWRKTKRPVASTMMARDVCRLPSLSVRWVKLHPCGRASQWPGFNHLLPLQSTLAYWYKWSEKEPGPNGRTSGSVCGQDPRFCLKPQSSPIPWADDITKWPVSSFCPNHIDCSIADKHTLSACRCVHHPLKHQTNQSTRTCAAR